jgi:hypothetical protein
MIFVVILIEEKQSTVETLEKLTFSWIKYVFLV